VPKPKLNRSCRHERDDGRLPTVSAHRTPTWLTTTFAHYSRGGSSTPRHLRNVLIRDQADRDAIASKLLRYRDGHGDDWADIIDMLTLYPDARRRVVRLLGESRGFLT
jgi:hypothetical protein